MPSDFPSAIRQLIADYKEATVLSSVSAVDHTRGGLGTQITGTRASSRPPRRGLGEAEQIEQAVCHLADAVRSSILGKKIGDERMGPREVRKGILATRGRASEVAAIYGRTERSVQELRASHGLDPTTGEKRPERPLTAPATETLKRLANEAEESE